MLYAKRTVSCPVFRMTKEAARKSLEKQFEDAEVLDLKRIGDRWSATLLEPKQAEFPPSKDDDSDSDGGPPPFTEDKDSDSDDSADSDAPDGPPSDGGEGDGPPKEKKGEGAELHAVLDLLGAIADKLGVMPGPGASGADDPSMMPPPPPGPAGPPMPHGGPGGGNELVHRTKLKPGETPPGGTPIGAPAFASTKTDLSRLASFDAFDDTPNKSIRQAKEELEALFGPQGFKVRQIKRVEGGRRLAAKLSRR
jgi:hypothetical protein